MQISRKTSQANRGKYLEEVIRISNTRYKVINQGIIIKVPTEWIPIRGAGGGITNAKVETQNKGVPDFMGYFPEIGPVAFDAKETNKGQRFSFQHIETEQINWLKDLSDQGWTTFTVHYFNEIDKAFLFPFQHMFIAYKKWEKYGAKKVPASISSKDFEEFGYQIKPGQALALDYKAAIEEWKKQ